MGGKERSGWLGISRWLGKKWLVREEVGGYWLRKKWGVREELGG